MKTGLNPSLRRLRKELPKRVEGRCRTLERLHCFERLAQNFIRIVLTGIREVRTSLEPSPSTFRISIRARPSARRWKWSPCPSSAEQRVTPHDLRMLLNQKERYLGVYLERRVVAGCERLLVDSRSTLMG